MPLCRISPEEGWSKRRTVWIGPILEIASKNDEGGARGGRQGPGADAGGEGEGRMRRGRRRDGRRAGADSREREGPYQANLDRRQADRSHRQADARRPA